jgi:HAD superfamily hydrolase (TIGR01509 family)
VVGCDARAVHDWCRRNLGLTLNLRDWLRLKYRTYFASAADLLPRGGAVDLFHQLRAEGRSQAIVSNSDRMVVGVNLDVVGLREPGLVTVSRNDVRAGKPDPEPYLRAAWLLQVDPGHCLVIEDSITGAKAGLAAGMPTLFWPQSETPTVAGARRVADVTDLAVRIREHQIT